MGKGLFGVDGEMASPPTKKSGSQKTKHLRSSRFLVVLKIRRQLLLTKASNQMVDKSWLTLIAGHPNDSDIWIDLAIDEYTSYRARAAGSFGKALSAVLS